MKSKVFFAATLCLLWMAGCTTPGGSSHGAAGLSKWLPGPLRAGEDDEAFAKKVDRDPFPRAQTGQMQVAVGP